MKIMADFCLIPVGAGVSLSSHIAACVDIIQTRGLTYQLNAYGTCVEGDWDEVFAAFKQCFETVHTMGAPRVHATLKIGSRNDREQSMNDKVQSVMEKTNTQN